MRMMKALCCLGHGDILVMDGQCQDKFLHRTDPCREQERINVTFRWIKQDVCSCPLFKAGVACCLPTCAQGSSVPVMENVASDVFLGFLASSRCLVHMESTSFAGLPVVYKTWVLDVLMVSISAELKSLLLTMCILVPRSTAHSLSSGSFVDAAGSTHSSAGE